MDAIMRGSHRQLTAGDTRAKSWMEHLIISPLAELRTFRAVFY